jgi:hypothetical protein
VKPKDKSIINQPANKKNNKGVQGAQISTVTAFDSVVFRRNIVDIENVAIGESTLTSIERKELTLP